MSLNHSELHNAVLYFSLCLPLNVKSSSDLIFALDPISLTFIKLSACCGIPIGYVNYFETMTISCLNLWIFLFALWRYAKIRYGAPAFKYVHKCYAM